MCHPGGGNLRTFVWIGAGLSGHDGQKELRPRVTEHTFSKAAHWAIYSRHSSINELNVRISLSNIYIFI